MEAGNVQPTANPPAEDTTAKADEEPVELTEEEKKAQREAEIEEALNCPCVDGMKDGPCGEPFIAAYRCFLESETEPKGSDCYESFMAMHKCIEAHPEMYNMDDDEEAEADVSKEAPGVSPAEVKMPDVKMPEASSAEEATAS